MSRLSKLKDLDDEVVEHKSAIRRRRVRLQTAARARAKLLRQLNNLGIEVVEQRAEKENSHGGNSKLRSNRNSRTPNS